MTAFRASLRQLLGHAERVVQRLGRGRFPGELRVFIARWRLRSRPMWGAFGLPGAPLARLLAPGHELLQLAAERPEHLFRWRLSPLSDAANCLAMLRDICPSRNRVLKRRTRAARIFPDREACLGLVAAAAAFERSQERPTGAGATRAWGSCAGSARSEGGEAAGKGVIRNPAKEFLRRHAAWGHQ